jgi:hypothetical protein
MKEVTEDRIQQTQKLGGMEQCCSWDSGFKLHTILAGYHLKLNVRNFLPRQNYIQFKSLKFD